MLLSVVWTYWFAFLLVLGAIAFVLATIGGYLYKVVRPKYPPRAQR